MNIFVTSFCALSSALYSSGLLKRLSHISTNLSVGSVRPWFDGEVAKHDVDTMNVIAKANAVLKIAFNFFIV